MSKIESSKFPKSKNNRNLTGNSITKLSDARIIQKKLVYVIGLSSSLANKEVMKNLYRLFPNKNTSDNTAQYQK
jgi:hypothetical protein